MNRYLLWTLVTAACVATGIVWSNPILLVAVTLYWMSWGFVLRNDTSYLCLWYGLPLRWDIGSYTYIEVYHWTIYDPQLIGPLKLSGSPGPSR